MKKIVLGLLVLCTAPLFAGVNCIEKSEHLDYMYDTKMWHSADCNCDCKNIRKNYCTECGHKQNAHRQIIIRPNAQASLPKSAIQAPPTIQEALKNLIALKNKQQMQ